MKNQLSTDAKEIALYFLKLTESRATPAIMGKTIVQAKSILESGYSKEEIMNVMDKIIERGITMYSIGYVSASINSVLRDINEERDAELARQAKKENARLIGEVAKGKRDEVKESDNSAERNRIKARKLGVQSRLGKKHNFDMFERPGED